MGRWITFETTGIDGVEGPMRVMVRAEDISVVQYNPDDTVTLITSVLNHYVVSKAVAEYVEKEIRNGDMA